MGSLAKGSRSSIYKAKTCLPDSVREQVWIRRKNMYATRRAEGAQTLNEDDIDELKGCIQLGFGFDSDRYPDLSRTFPALTVNCSGNKHANCLSRTSFESYFSSIDYCELKGEPEMVKLKLKQWAQAVACFLIQVSGYPC